MTLKKIADSGILWMMQLRILQYVQIYMQQFSISRH